jgi:hypothetical protein
LRDSTSRRSESIARTRHVLSPARVLCRQRFHDSVLGGIDALRPCSRTSSIGLMSFVNKPITRSILFGRMTHRTGSAPSYLTRKGSKFTDLRNASCMTNQRESWPPQCLTEFVRYPTKLVACLRRKEFFHLLLAIQSSRERLSLPVVKSGNEVLCLASYFKLS